jgi:hypothetical protein
MEAGVTPGQSEPGLIESGKEKAQEGLQKAKETGVEKAKETGLQAKDQVARQVDERSTTAGEQVATLAEATRKMSQELRNQGQGTPARLAEQAAEQAERLGRYLQDGDSDRFMGDFERAARRQPWAVAGGAFVLGIAAARFLKASAARRREANGGESSNGVVSGEARRLPEATAPAPPAPLGTAADAP